MAGLLTIIFIGVSLAAFTIYALSRTVFEPTFYSEKIVDGSYDLVVNTSTTQLLNNSEELKGYFTESELKNEIERVFTKKIFGEIMADFADILEQVKESPNENAKLSLVVLRESLLTVVNNLIYRIYQELPACADGNAGGFNNDGIPQCVPEGVGYDQLVGPLLNNFEAGVYRGIPEELNEVNRIVPGQVLQNVELAKNVIFISLLIVLALMALLLYQPISLIVGFIAWAFLLSGALGLLMSTQASTLVKAIRWDIDESAKVEVMKYFEYLFNFVFLEIQKISLIFAIFGLALLLIYFVLKRTVDVQKGFK